MITLTTPDLMRELTDALLHDDTDAKHIYENSKYSKALLEKGKSVINEIGRYLSGIRSHLSQLNPKEKNKVEHGWILLLCAIKDKEGIETRTIFAGNIDLWITWALEYKP